MTTASPFDWLKDLCTYFDWLHSGSLALANNRPLPPSDAVPDHAVGEIMRAFVRIQDTQAAQRAEHDTLKAALASRDAEAASLRAETEAKWQHERRVLEERFGAVDGRLRDLTGRLAGHARTLNAVAADLSASTAD